MRHLWPIIFSAPFLILFVGNLFQIVHSIVEFAPIFNLAAFLTTLAFISWRLSRYKSITTLVLPLLITVLAFFIGNAPHSWPDKFDLEPSVRVLSWNVGQFKNDTNNVQGVIETIEKLDPDMIFLQEFGLYYKWPNVEAMSEDFAGSIGMKYYHFEPHKDNIFGTAVFSKHEIDTSTLIFNQLSITNEAWAHVFTLEERSFAVANVHLESYDLRHSNSWDITEKIKKRAAQIDLVNDELELYQSHIIVGDLNTLAGTSLYHRLLGNRIDAVRSNGLGWVSTFRDFPMRIDHVFHSAKTSVSRVQTHSNKFSDHRLIQFDISI